MTDLRERLAELDSVDFPDLSSRIQLALEAGDRPIVLGRPRSPRRRFAPATVLAVFFATLGVVGGLIWLIGGFADEQPPAAPDEPVPVTSSVPVTAAPGPIPDRPPSVESFEITQWQEVLLDRVVFEPGSQISGFADSPGGTFALGVAPGGAALWHTTNGVEWARLPVDFGTGAIITDVAVGGPGVVAVGVDQSGDRPVAAVWTSVDGIEWNRLPLESEVVAGATARMNAVVSGSFGLVAAGQACELDPGPCPGRPALWQSPDGLSWERVVLDGPGAVSDIAIGGPGLVAVGSVGDGPTDGAVWTSFDAKSWSAVVEPSFGGEGNQWIAGVAARSGSVVAVGGSWLQSGEPSHSMVWSSQDGRDWTLGDDEISSGPLNAVAAGGPAYVVVGDGTSGAEGVVWSSGDGRAWAPYPDVVGDMQSVAATSFGLVATDGRRLWTTPPVASAPVEDPAPDWEARFGLTPEPVTLGGGWTRLGFDPDTFGRAEVAVDGAAAGPGGILALGRAGSGYAAWTSPDGIVWRRAGIADVISGSVDVTAVAANDGGYVVVGARGEYRRSLAYFSANGVDWREIELAQDPGAVIAAVVNWNGIFVAAGLDSAAAQHPTVWMSEDGMDWAVAYSDAEALVDPDMGGIGLTVSPEAILLVAIDFDPADQTSARFPVWLSYDGITFTKTDGLGDLCPDPVAADPKTSGIAGKLAVVCGQSGLLFLSADGATWEEPFEYSPSFSDLPFEQAFTGAGPAAYESIAATGILEIDGREVSLGSVCLTSESLCAVAVLVRD